MTTPSDPHAAVPVLEPDGPGPEDDTLTPVDGPRGTRVGPAVVVVASFLLGMATFFAQDFLPDAVTSFANSSSGWTLVTVLLLTWARARPAVAALLGAISFVLLTVGYSAAAQLQGLYYDPTLFSLVGLVAGPVVGVATSWLRAVPSWRPALGTALLAGIGVGEAGFGLTAVAGSTSPVYWVLIAVLALALLVAMLTRRIRGVLWRLVAVIGTCSTAGAFLVGYGWLGGPST